MQTENIILERR